MGGQRAGDDQMNKDIKQAATDFNSKVLLEDAKDGRSENNNEPEELIDFEDSHLVILESRKCLEKPFNFLFVSKKNCVLKNLFPNSGHLNR